ncbi:MAG: acyl-[acyl-carrier-protein]--UDP-N-acetylglucosamine O-acyltransferase [Acidiferrobacteraceae bacterium]|nr:acyl-[acyl-carrier-protein]--UDP-N-acetylglucosamine O-acyltransferase [Acidiferrobacteraceae bacterium]
MIDARAIVGQSAEIEPGVTIGAFTVVEDGVSIGANTWIGPHVVIRRNTTIGKRNKIYQFSSIGEDPQYSGYQGEETFLEIGDDNIVREYCTLNRGSPAGSGVTKVGNGNLIMAYVHIAHDSTLGNNVVFANGASLAGHVEINDYAILGGFTLVHQFCRVGAYSMTGIGTVCVKDVPPYVLAVGNVASPKGLNVRGLRRHGFEDSVIVGLKKAYRVIYRHQLSLTEIIIELDRLAESYDEIKKLVKFIRTSQRGIIRK